LHVFLLITFRISQAEAHPVNYTLLVDL